MLLAAATASWGSIDPDGGGGGESERRFFFGGTLSLPMPPRFPSVASASAADVDVASASAAAAECRDDDDALAAESAVPGAYQQSCMSLPLRNIPVRVPVVATTSKSSSTTFVTKTVVVRQGTDSGAGSTGMAVWNSSLLLKRLLERLSGENPAWLRDKTVLELGCGPGLVGIASALLGARKVIATDGNPAVVDLARRNVLENRPLFAPAYGADATTAEEASPPPVVTASELQWGMLDAMEYADEGIDWVVGSDLTYNPASWRPLAETIATILSSSPTGKALYLSLGHAGFNANGEIDGFLAVAKQQGLEVLAPSETDAWPFPQSPSLSDLLLRGISNEERDILDSTGGVQVLLLGKQRQKQFR